MSANWRARQFGIVGATAVLLVVASTLLELGNNFKQTIDSAAIESRLVAEGIQRELSFLAADEPTVAIPELLQRTRVRRAMLDAQASARSVLHVAIYDPRGRILAHTLSSREGELVEPVRTLPQLHGLLESVAELWLLWRRPTDFATEWPLVGEGDAPLVVIRVVSASAFLLHGVEASFRRGILSIVLLVAVASAAGAIAARTTSQRLRELEASIVALREGRRQDLQSESGWADFDRVARELNLLSEQFAIGERGSDARVLPGVELLGAAILVVDAGGRLLLANQEGCQRIGLVARDGAPIAELLGQQHVVTRMTQRLLQGENRVLVAPLQDAGDGYLAIGHAIAGNGAVAGAMIEIKSASEQADLNSRVQRSRAVAHLGQVAAGVAHELRGPLQGLEFDLDRLDSSWGEPESSQKVLQELRTKIQRLEWVVGGFLKVARVRPLRLMTLHAQELLEAVCESLEADALMAGIELRLEPADGNCRVLGDWDTLSRALENVVGNALEALPSQSAQVLLSCRQEGDRVEIAVHDDGPGIPADRQREVFNLYFTTKPRGTGVGLAVVRQAVELHNGEVEIASSPGEGTTLTLVLPAAPTL